MREVPEGSEGHRLRPSLRAPLVLAAGSFSTFEVARAKHFLRIQGFPFLKC